MEYCHPDQTVELSRAIFKIINTNKINDLQIMIKKRNSLCPDSEFEFVIEVENGITNI